MSDIFPSEDEVHEKIDQAIAQLIEYDEYLLQIDANERTISHRLGMYLQLLFTDWHVDCEYNRNLDSPKRLEAYELVFYEEKGTWNIADTNSVTVFPDIIIHRRGTHDNLLIIEIKKSTSNRSSKSDYIKLREFKDQYGYKHALFLKLKTGCDDIGVETKDYLPEPNLVSVVAKRYLE